MSQVQALPHDIMPEAGQLSLILICQEVCEQQFMQ